MSAIKGASPEWREARAAIEAMGRIVYDTVLGGRPCWGAAGEEARTAAAAAMRAALAPWARLRAYGDPYQWGVPDWDVENIEVQTGAAGPPHIVGGVEDPQVFPRDEAIERMAKRNAKSKADWAYIVSRRRCS